jgi:hypothetical protein
VAVEAVVFVMVVHLLLAVVVVMAQYLFGLGNVGLG